MEKLPIKITNGQIEVELQETFGSDKRIAEAAWTSSTTLQGKEKRTDEDVARVVKMLIEQKHSSPIESVVFRFWIKMPIAIDRQHMTHRVASHNGMSGRYRTMPSEFLSMPKDVRDLSEKALVGIMGKSVQVNNLIYEYQHLCTTANIFYNKMSKFFKAAEAQKAINNLEYKRLREFYRGVLPQHNMTERVTVMNLRSFANYQKLRNSKHAQPEIQEVAQLMLEVVEKANVCPVTIATLKELNWEI